MKLERIQEKLEAKHHIFMVYRNQVNKDLERSGFDRIEENEPDAFVKRLISVLSEAIECSDLKLQQLYYLADVQEKNLEKGIVLAFIVREWVKIRFRLGQ
jgi:ribonucleotide monophosphatase NagD (HAD superfamily)